MHPTRPPQGSEQPTGTPALLPLDQFKNVYARKLLDPRKIAALKDSIIREGLLEPLHASARNNIVIGTCRFTILGELGHRVGPVVMHPEATDEAGELRLVFAGDAKSDRHIADSASLLAEYRSRHSVTWEAAAKQFGISPATASRYKAILDQPQAVLDAFRRDDLSLTLLLELKNAPADRRVDLMKRVLDDHLDQKQTRLLVKGRKTVRKPVRLTVGKVVLELPPDMLPADLRDTLKGQLFPAIEKATPLKLGVGDLGKIIAALPVA